MSRYCGNKNAEPILNAGEHWKKVALLGEGNFFEKLQTRLETTEPEVKQLASEMLWLMLLCPDNIGAPKKRSGAKTIWDWSAEPFPQDNPPTPASSSCAW